MNASNDQINLALRQAGDALLKAQGDHYSRLPPIQVFEDNVYVLIIHSNFDYSILPETLEKALDDYNIDTPYEVMIKSCDSETLLLGFNKLAVRQDSVACREREGAPECARVHIRFEEKTDDEKFGNFAWLILPIVGAGGVFYIRSKKERHESIEEDNCFKIGELYFNATSQTITIANQEEIKMTYRENKLLLYFAQRQGEVLPRERIQAAVWEDEGIIVGRSLDVFVSRLRKILSKAPSVSIKTVHGVGYRLEVLKQ